VSELQHPDSRSFELVAGLYERARPEYPGAAIAWLAQKLDLREGRTVLDLGAGTGKLTRALLTTGARVIAVEPGDAMRAELVRGLPGAEALRGAAEQIPVHDASVGAVAVGQAFHWFRHDEALPEIHRVLTADGVVSLIGCLMGNPFINAVYIGHPGWKAMGGRIGYSAATGIMVIILSWFAVVSVLLALVPVVAISPILLYIGMLIGAQAFQTTPVKHAPAIVLALTPHLAAWSKTLMDGALGAAGTSAAAVGFDKLGQVGVLYHGLEVLGGGSILTGLVLGAIGVFVIEKKFVEASAFALSGAVLTFFGFMHGESVGLAVTPTVAIAYTIIAVFLFGLSRSAAILSAVGPAEQKAVAATPAE